MLKRYRSAAVGLGALLVTSGIVFAAGNWSTYPIVGGQSFCASTVTGAGGLGGATGQGQASTGSICAQMVPAGPTFTGEEMIPADTQSLNGGGPQTVLLPNALLGPVNPKRNRIIGGDFGTNLWQRGTTPLSAASPTTATMAADRFFAYSASTQVTIIKETAAADVTANLTASMRVQRPSAQTGTGAVCVGQILDKVQAEDFLGQNAIFSFYALAGTNLSSANSNLTVTVAYYTAADSTTPGTNTASFAAGTITGYQAAVAGLSGATVGSVASGVATIPISSTWGRYSVYAPIPTANAAGTAVIGVGITICDTPVGTAGTNDWFEIAGVSLNAVPSAPTNILSAGVTSPIGFERRPAAEEETLQYYYTSPGGLGTEVATGYYMAGICKSTGVANFPIVFPVPMRAIPTTATSTLTAGGYSIQTAAAVTAIGTVTIAGASIYGAVLNSTAACTATLPYAIVGSNTTGLILFSAEP